MFRAPCSVTRVERIRMREVRLEIRSQYPGSEKLGLGKVTRFPINRSAAAAGFFEAQERFGFLFPVVRAHVFVIGADFGHERGF